ncbi:HAD family hydrolase [Telmatobacter bradus]|uniref:HAD family hydrolase n=1 Tax=Telmatobacter bradus TaxID=474953 RepID=UPI003B42B882
MALRAVIFDYGMVLSGPPQPEIRAELLRRIGKSTAESEALYMKYRHDYDLGFLTGLEYWHKIFIEAGLPLEEARITETADLDAAMWTGTNQPMLDWQRSLKQKGLKAAILSNMGDRVLANMKRHLPWIEEFDVQVWSYALKIAKPDPAIYRHTLAALGLQANETLFVDDLLVNVEAARAVGLKAAQYVCPSQLRDELLALGLAAEIPLPA